MARAQDTLKVGNISAPIVSKGMGTQEILGGSASKRYTVGKYFVGNDGYYYLVSQTIEKDATITAGTNCTKTDLAAEIEGKAPTNHASAQATYGVGDANNYGHVKVDASPTANSTNALQSGGAKSALDGKAPTSHASSNTTYGVGSTTNYGHVKVDDALSSTSTNPVQNKKVYELKQALSDEVDLRNRLGAKNIQPPIYSGYRYFDSNTSVSVINENEFTITSTGNYGRTGFSFVNYVDVGKQYKITFKIKGKGSSSAPSYFVLRADSNIVVDNPIAGKSFTTDDTTYEDVTWTITTTSTDLYFLFYVQYGAGSGNSISIKDFMVRPAEIADDTFVPYGGTNQYLSKNKISWIDNVILGAHNLLPNDAVSDTKNGVTFTVNADMSITISTGSGGATANSIVGINTAYKPPKGTYKLSSGILDNKFYLTIDAYNGNTWVKGIGNTASGDAVFTVDYVGYDTIRVYVAVLSGAVYTTAKTIYPMITLATDTDTTYQPYAMTNQQLTENKAEKSDLASISITGTTNSTGSTIAAGTYFYLNGTLARAKTDIANSATFTLNTNYEVVTAGGLNDLLNNMNPIALHKKQSNGDVICNNVGFYLLIANNSEDTTKYYIGVAYKAASSEAPIVVSLSNSGITTGATNAAGTIVFSGATSVASYRFRGF